MDNTTPSPDEKDTHNEVDPQMSKDVKELNFLSLIEMDKKGNSTASAEAILSKDIRLSPAQIRFDDAQLNISDSISHFKSTDIDGYKKFKSLSNNADGSYTDKQLEFLKVNVPLAFKPAVEFNDALASLTAERKSFEALEKKFQLETVKKEEAKPNAVERALGRQLLSSLRSGELANTQEMLQNIQKMEAEARTRILNSFANEVAKLPMGGLSMVRWETGTKNNGEEFIRLNININDSFSKSSGGTNITVATDQNPSATYRNTYDAKPMEIDPNSALESIILRSPKLITDPFFEQNQKPGRSERYIEENLRQGYKELPNRTNR